MDPGYGPLVSDVSHVSLDYEQAARELVRAIRGRRSQVALSRRLGYRSNVLYMWESGRRWPTATEAFRAARACRIDLRAALDAWYRTPPAWLSELTLADPGGVARFLQHEQGTTPLGVLAARAGRNRYSVARWIHGTSEPRLPDFLRVVEAASMRVVDLIAHLVGPDAVPAAASVWARREARRNAVIEEPWSQAVLRCLDLADGPRRADAIARRLQLDPERVARSVAVLALAGQVRIERDDCGDVLVPVPAEALDTRRSEATARRLKGFWLDVAAARLAALDAVNDADHYAYNVFSVSRAQLARLRELQQSHWRAVRALVAEDEPPEVVALLNLQLVRLDADADADNDADAD